MLAGARVKWKARMLYSSAASNVSANGTKYPESSNSPPINCTVKNNAAKCDDLIAVNGHSIRVGRLPSGDKWTGELTRYRSTVKRAEVDVKKRRHGEKPPMRQMMVGDIFGFWRSVTCDFGIRYAGIMPIAKLLKRDSAHHQFHAVRSAK
jgi:hypothetical protein